MTERTFDYLPRHDERSRSYAVAPAETALLGRSRFWVPGHRVLDQGREGACVGHGIAHEAAASPNRIRGIDETVAHAVYKRAQQLDPWPGESYEGTSVLAGMKAGQERGWWTGYRWAFDMDGLRAALEEGPVVVGVVWFSGMYSTTDDGWLWPDGRPVGWHCILVTGYSAPLDGYRVRNSWGRDWGRNGNAYVGSGVLNQILFVSGGEAAVPVGRA